MKEAKSLFPKAGQTALLWMNDKVLLKRDYTSESVIYTRFDSFIGTKEEVEAKITELGLKEQKVPEVPTISKPSAPSTNPMQASQSTQPAGVIANTVNFIKSIFGN
jgi:hypothetical protein